MKLVEAAQNDVGVKERAGQYGFDDEQFETLIRDIGWTPGRAWACFAIEKWVRQALPERATELNGFFVESVPATFRNLKNAGFTISIVPTVGALVFMQRIEDGFPIWLGQAGIVSRVISGVEFYSIEGDSKEGGQPPGREISGVLVKHRIIKKIVHEGLKVVGFIQL